MKENGLNGIEEFRRCNEVLEGERKMKTSQKREKIKTQIFVKDKIMLFITYFYLIFCYLSVEIEKEEWKRMKFSKWKKNVSQFISSWKVQIIVHQLIIEKVYQL